MTRSRTNTIAPTPFILIPIPLFHSRLNDIHLSTPSPPSSSSQPPFSPQVRQLQVILAPILLRRMKEDVETLPEKEEVIVWVQLTTEQRQYYK